ncbi:MAG: N-acetylmuramoyl-L-alanine amidase [Oscillospiraceae bacterium]|jgi:hypothetical protein|nr:N-acetylmuramoyl-L-alanine amidase [Oscillospiraceae bacterium]
MESASNLLIAVDAGHGGWDNGAQGLGRREKDDNLALALEVQRQLERQGLQVLMTRSDDTFVELADRAAMANEADADLFVSLHRNSFTRPTDETYGIENYIYLTAPPETSGRAAQLVLSELDDVGVQRIVGVSRGNYAVLRRTLMPAMLLEMGYIINETDNLLFDENLTAYAQAIAKGIMEYFGLVWNANATPPTPPLQPEENEIYDMQQLLESRYGFGLTPTGRYDDPTRRAVTVALQIELNGAYNAGLAVDGKFGPLTAMAIRPIRQGDQGALVALLQVLLTLNGYDPGEVDGYFGPRTATALRFFQRDHFLTSDAIAGRESFTALIKE